MTPFQWLALSALGVVLLAETVGWLRRPGFGFARTFRCLVWLGAGLAIYDPDLLQRAASAVGITRGADLVFYLAVLTFLGVSFYFYSRYVRLQTQMTELVRHIAVREARRGEEKQS
jgi:hypothetical protein